MPNEPLITVVVLLRDFFHLANLTLKSIVDQTSDLYEIIVLETAETKRDLMMLKPYQEKIKIVQHFEESDLAQLMNRGLELAKGKYIHFLFSGDVYISKYVIAYLKELIEEKNFPDLICSAFLRRDEMNFPEAVSFSFDYFKKGDLPMNIQTCWILIDTIKKLKGFSKQYTYQSGFDMVCKIFLQKDKKIIFSNRVLTDYQPKKNPSKISLYIVWEGIKIIYRNFGLVKTFFWRVVYDHLRFLKFFMVSVKKSFWNP